MIRQYIGARYTIKVYENTLNPSSAEWESGRSWEPLVLVTFNNSSYLSKKEIPSSIGDPASNPSYWVCTGYYNGQISQLQLQIDALKLDKVSVFNSVADMAATDLLDGQICRTTGFFNPGDNGASWYIISDSGTANGVDVIACGALFAHLVYSDEMHIKQFGAIENTDISAILYLLIDSIKTLKVSGNYLINERSYITYNIIGDGAATFTTPSASTIGNSYVDDANWYSNNENHRPSVLRIDAHANITISDINVEGDIQADLSTPTPLLFLIIENSINIKVENVKLNNHGRGILLDGGRNHNITLKDIIITGQTLYGIMTENSFASDSGYQSSGILIQNCYGAAFVPIALGTGIVTVEDSFFYGNMNATYGGFKSTPLWVHSNEVNINEINATFKSCFFKCKYKGVYLINGFHSDLNTVDFDYVTLSFNNCNFDARENSAILHCIEANNINSIKISDSVLYKRILTDNVLVDANIPGSQLTKGQMFYTMDNCQIVGDTDTYPTVALIRGGLGIWSIRNCNIVCQSGTSDAIVAKGSLTMDSCVITNASYVVSRASGNDNTVISNCRGDYTAIANGANYNNFIYNFGSGGKSTNGILASPITIGTIQTSAGIPNGTIVPDTTSGKLYWKVSGTGVDNVWKDAAGNVL